MSAPVDDSPPFSLSLSFLSLYWQFTDDGGMKKGEGLVLCAMRHTGGYEAKHWPFCGIGLVNDHDPTTRVIRQNRSGKAGEHSGGAWTWMYALFPRISLISSSSRPPNFTECLLLPMRMCNGCNLAQWRALPVVLGRTTAVKISASMSRALWSSLAT